MSAPGGRLVAVDCGTKRVGLAIADPLEMFAQPYGTFSPDAAIRELEGLHGTEVIATIVVGWPLQLDGTKGPATDMVERFVARLRKRVRGANVVLQDERHTSELAREMLTSGPVPSLGDRRKGRLDTAAAGLILQDYLDHRDL